MMTTNVFVYGTLRKGGRLSAHMRRDGVEFLGSGEVAGFALYDLGSYPAAAPVPQSGSWVRGEVYRVDAAALANLDRVEGVPTLYRRGPTGVRMDRGAPEWLMADIYYMAEADASRWGDRMTVNDWTAYTATRPVPSWLDFPL